jgi:hypothetical protein
MDLHNDDPTNALKTDERGCVRTSETASKRSAPLSVSTAWNLRVRVFCRFAWMQAGLYRGISLATSTAIVGLYEPLDPIDDLEQHVE